MRARRLRPGRRRSPASDARARLPKTLALLRPRRRAKSRSADDLVRLQREAKALRMRLCVVERDRDVAPVCPSGCSKMVGFSAKSERCSSGTRSSTMSFASFARTAMRGSTRSLGETQSQTSSGRSVKIVPFDSMWTRRPSRAQCLDQRGRLGLRERFAAGQHDHRAVAAGSAHAFARSRRSPRSISSSNRCRRNRTPDCSRPAARRRPACRSTCPSPWML